MIPLGVLSSAGLDIPEFRSAVVDMGPEAFWLFGETMPGPYVSEVNAYTATEGYAGEVVSSGASSSPSGSSVSLRGTIPNVDCLNTNYHPSGSLTGYSIMALISTADVVGTVANVRRPASSNLSMTLNIGPNGGSNSTVHNGHVQFGLDCDGIWRGVSSQPSARLVSDGNWHLVAGVWAGASGVRFDADQLSVFVDDSFVSKTLTTVGSTPSSAPYQFGGSNGNYQIGNHPHWSNGGWDRLNVAIGGIAFFEHAVSESELQSVAQTIGLI